MVSVTRNQGLLLTVLLALALWLILRPQDNQTPLPVNQQPTAEEAIATDLQSPKTEPFVKTTDNKATATPASPEQPPAVPSNTAAVNANRYTFTDLQFEHDRLARVIGGWHFKDYQRYSAKAGIEGEAAYQAYLYVKSCIGSQTTAASYNEQLVQLQVLFDRNRERVSAGELEARLNELEQGFIRCEGLGEKPLRAAVEWLQLAADLAYLPAQIGFYRELPELLRQDRWAVFRKPDFLDLYQLRTPEYLVAALKSGHPDAFRHFAVAIIDGIVFEPDSVLALAYYHAADLAGGSGQASLRDADPVSGLGARELREARLIGENLCSQYCR
jgi:hypothetical protein